METVRVLETVRVRMMVRVLETVRVMVVVMKGGVVKGWKIR